MKDVLFSWDFPTTRVEGGPLDIDDIAHVQVQVSADAGANWTDLGNVDAPTNSLAWGNVPIGDWLVRMTVELTDGQRSVDVDTAFAVIDDSAPNGVVNVQVTFS